eukprot:TRINITY_DN2440_c0_g2_i1.p1 TRINITY_DN2440_c0_g2~~TRINITY_DN2440_c0_g2_i1.p1  ORF type:complete len:520 (+),score=72.92 TRINITY_DN2440_c0_g2_i1:107-1666(+)
MLSTIAVVVLAIVAVTGFALRSKLWLLWCGVVLVWRGLRGQVGPSVNSKKTDMSRPPCKSAIEKAPLELQRMVEQVSVSTPCFGIKGSDVEILSSPKEFYESLLKEIATAEERIYIAALYLGVSDYCRKITQALGHRLKTNSHLKVTAVFDYGRGMRTENGISVLDLFADLVEKYRERIDIRLFMVPLCGAIFRHAPATIREIAGVQHMKATVIDDKVMITGANLNDDYFTNRQDRYMWVRSKPVSDWVSELLGTIAGMSFECLVNKENRLGPLYPENVSHPVWSGPSPSPVHEFSDEMYERLSSLLYKCENVIPPDSDTLVFPFIQMAAIGLHHEFDNLIKILETVPMQCSLTLSSAYPNLTPKLSKAIRDCAASDVTLIAPAEDASGFHGARGAKGLVPPSYTSFLSSVVTKYWQRTSTCISLWSKHGWTYHGKGAWFPGGTLIGSSNFGYRSDTLDAELQFLIITQSVALQRKLDSELANLTSNCSIANVQEQYGSMTAKTKVALSVVTGVLYPFL